MKTNRIYKEQHENPIVIDSWLKIDGVAIASIRGDTVSPMHGYYPRHPYAKRVKAYAKRHGLKAPLYCCEL